MLTCEKKVPFASVLTFVDLPLLGSHLLVSTSANPGLQPDRYPGTWVDGKSDRTDIHQLRRAAA